MPVSPVAHATSPLADPAALFTAPMPEFHKEMRTTVRRVRPVTPASLVR
jgi:hypothetical protein